MHCRSFDWLGRRSGEIEQKSGKRLEVLGLLGETEEHVSRPQLLDSDRRVETRVGLHRGVQRGGQKHYRQGVSFSLSKIIRKGVAEET